MATAVSLTTTGRRTPGRVEECVYRSKAPVETAVAPVATAVKAPVAPVKAAVTPVLNVLAYIRESFLNTRAYDWRGRSR